MTKRTLMATTIAAAALLGAQAPTIASAANWTGFYVGAHAGGAFGDVDLTAVSNNTSVLNFPVGGEINHSPDGVLGGAQLGFDWQMSNWVFGVEVAGSGLDFDDTIISPFAGTELSSVEVEWAVTAAVRLGWTWDNSLLYLRGGYAGGNVKTLYSDFSSPVETARSDEMHNGFVIGAGFEHMIGDRVSVGVEYNYLDLGETDHSAPGSVTGALVTDVDVRIHAVTAKLNWRLFTP